MKKFTKEQREAIDLLLLDLDELENKPRRLFYALEQLAHAFDKTDSIPSLREAQDLMYSHINEGDMYQELFRSLRKFKIKEWRWQINSSTEGIGNSNTRIAGAEDFILKHIKELSKRRFY